MDKIHIRDLRLRCIIGVYPEERRLPAEVVINVSIECFIPKASQTDRIEDTLNYEILCEQIVKRAKNRTFHLIETLAEEIASICLEQKETHRVHVTVDKPDVLHFSRSVAVEITRESIAP